MSWNHQHSAPGKQAAKDAVSAAPGLPDQVSAAICAAIDGLTTPGAVLVVTSGHVAPDGSTHADFKVMPHIGPEAGRGSGFTPA